MEKTLEGLVARQWAQFGAIVPVRTPLYFRLCRQVFSQCKTTTAFHDVVQDLKDVPSHLRLALAMSASEMLTERTLDEEDCRRIVELATDLESQTVLDHEAIAKTASQAPNLCALIGSPLAVQVLTTIKLEVLAKTPSSNLPNKIPQLEDSDLIRRFSPNEKQALRQLCGKMVLCARLDLQGTATDTMGRRWFEEIDNRLNKFKKAPEVQAIKPLPVPMETKSKKRGGRRIRKLKEKMEMSQVEKLQNRVAFGETETTKIVGDEEVGMGLLDKKKVETVRLLAKRPETPTPKPEEPSDDFQSDLLQFL